MSKYIVESVNSTINSWVHLKSANNALLKTPQACIRYTLKVTPCDINHQKFLE